MKSMSLAMKIYLFAMKKKYAMKRKML
jgi:hypothetical protein